MAINASDIEALALIKQSTVDGETNIGRDADDTGKMIQLANNLAVNSRTKTRNAIDNMITVSQTVVRE